MIHVWKGECTRGELTGVFCESLAIVGPSSELTPVNPGLAVRLIRGRQPPLIYCVALNVIMDDSVLPFGG